MNTALCQGREGTGEGEIPFPQTVMKSAPGGRQGPRLSPHVRITASGAHIPPGLISEDFQRAFSFPLATGRL